MNRIVTRVLNGEDREDRRDLQTVFDESPGYSYAVSGKPPSPTSAEETFAALPPHSHKADKCVFGFYLENTVVGCADIIRDYPKLGITWIGLLLFCEKHQGKSYGQAALSEIIDTAKKWESKFLRLAVIDTNPRALKFWEHQKFASIGTKAVDGFVGKAIVMERALTTRCS
ncbi:GNAT family N-acetyltransferase [Salinisphaera sp. SPP-AMP-43]|uniref:GNAT family N-acetyltransferase n=1 Tax=Salinisphaera sp. SPP-AMP-43 TaxID=3121288 RepID=UPI003C6E5108